MTEALCKQPSLAELKVAARVLLEEDSSLTAAGYVLRMQNPKNLLDESIRQSNVGTKTYLDHLAARCRLDDRIHTDPIESRTITFPAGHVRAGKVRV
jgi:hypothetical protein